jgi:nucleoid-associated protein EbfC
VYSGQPAGLRLRTTTYREAASRKGGLAGSRYRATGGLKLQIGGTVDPGGQLDMQQLLAAAQQMQSQLMSAQQELADAEVEGTAGGGLVTAVVNGQGELVDLTISAEAIDPADPGESAQTIADLVLAAVRDAYRAVGDLQQQTMEPLAAGFGGAEGGMGLPGLPGMPCLDESSDEPGDGSDSEP